ncbi:hypothetical protein ACHAXR_008291 [Thalassiosira sp. AJA248-18]
MFASFTSFGGENTFMLSLLGGGALGSFAFSTTAGRAVEGIANESHYLTFFIRFMQECSAHVTSNLQFGQRRKCWMRRFSGENDATNTADHEMDAAHRRARTLRCKASMKRRLETGYSLSDTHGNTWSHNEPSEEMQKDKSMHRAEAWGRRQTNRRETIEGGMH